MISHRRSVPFGQIIFLFLSSYLFILSSSTQAAVMLSGGLTHQYNVSGGQRVSGVFQLRNASNAPAELKLYQEDSSPVGGNKGHSRSNKPWLRLSADRVTLAPGASRKVSYTMQIPANAQKGTYWSLVMLEPVSKKSRESQVKKKPQDENSFTVSVQQKVRYAVNIMTHLQGGSANLIFSAPKVEQDPKNQKVFAIDIQNTGSKYARPTVSMEVFNKKGEPVKTLTGEARGVYPAAKKRFTVPLAGLRPGDYKVLFVAEDKDSGRTFGADVNLAVKP
jgi:hypothetical protein